MEPRQIGRVLLLCGSAFILAKVFQHLYAISPDNMVAFATFMVATAYEFGLGRKR